MERSLSKRNHREIQACSARKAVDCLASKREEVSCHKSWHEMTPAIRHLKSVSGGASNNAFRYTTAPIGPFSVHLGCSIIIPQPTIGDDRRRLRHSGSARVFRVCLLDLSGQDT